MNALVGYTGFVGSNLYASGTFDAAFNSKNIREAYGLHPDLLVYAGLRAEKYLANSFPEKDLALILEAEENIRRIAPEKLVLISTVDVYGDPVAVDEDSVIETEGLHPYGANRYALEMWVRKNYPDALIIRLPGLFGKNIRKNFIYDYITRIPFMLKTGKMKELSVQAPILVDYYEQLDNGFYKCRELNAPEKEMVRDIFGKLHFSALNFTDSRSVYQFYPLYRLWGDIQTALLEKILLWNPATEPVSAEEVYHFLDGGDFNNELPSCPAFYDCRTKYAALFGGGNGYIMNKQQVLEDIRIFTESMRKCK